MEVFSGKPATGHHRRKSLESNRKIHVIKTDLLPLGNPLHDMNIWNRVLSASEISKLSNHSRAITGGVMSRNGLI